MTQEIIKKKLIGYLKVRVHELAHAVDKDSSINQKAREELEKRIKHIESQPQTSGYCFGISLTEAAFDFTGYGRWRQEAIMRICNWNMEDIKALDMEVDLSAYLPAFHQPQHDAKQPMRLRDLFDRAVDDVITQHGVIDDANRGFMLNDVSQFNILDPDTRFFEFAVNKEIKHIESKASVAGYFSPSRLLALLDNNKHMIAETMCLIHSQQHTINIKYKNNKDWVMYDPNYKHECIETMSKTFTSTSLLVQEIIKQLYGHSLAIDLVTLDTGKEVKLSACANLTARDMAELIDEDGLHMIIIHHPAQLNDMLNMAAKDKDFACLFANALMRVDLDGCTGMSLLARYAPDYFPQLMRLAHENQQICKAIAKTVSHLDPYDWTGLEMIARYVPGELSNLFLLADKSNDLLQAIINMIPHQDPSHWTGLHVIARYAPNAICALLELAGKHEYLADVIQDTLVVYNKSGCSALDMIERYARDSYLQAKTIKDTCVSSLEKIGLILFSSEFWRDHTYSLKSDFPSTVVSLQVVKKSEGDKLKRVELLNKYEKIVSENIKYESAYPFIYSLFHIKRSDKTRAFYQIICDLPTNKNNAFARLEALYQEVQSYHQDKMRTRTYQGTR